MTLSFGLDVLSAFEDLERALDKLKHDDLNKDLARECACKAWHLSDHVFNELGAAAGFKDLLKFQEHIRSDCRELAYLQDICIASKHGKITRYSPRIIEACEHEGDFCPRDFSRDFDISHLQLKLHDGETLFFIDVADRAVAFWSLFLAEHGFT